MRNKLLIATLFAFIAWNAQSQTVEKNDTTESKEVIVKFLFGLYEWTPSTEKTASVDFQSESASTDLKKFEMLENDSTVVKSIFWGAVQWTEKKKKNTALESTKETNNSK